MRWIRAMAVLGCVLWLAACGEDEVWQTRGPNDLPDSADGAPRPASGSAGPEMVTDGQHYTGIAVDSGGKVHISCFDSAGLIYAGGNSGDWRIALVDSGPVNLGEGNDIAVGPDKMPQISYRASQTEVRLARFDGTNWNILTVGTGDRLGAHTAIAVDSLNRPHIVYYDERERFVRYAMLAGSTWIRESVAELENWEQRVDIAVDGNGVPHVTFLGYSGGMWSLKYATRTTTGWQSSAVDRSGSFSHPSIAVQADGIPHMSYHRITDGGGAETLDLLYAVWANNRWEIAVVDSDEDVGDYGSIALDSAGQPRISYVDLSNRALKYAYLSGGLWTNEILDANSPSRGVAWQTAIAVDARDSVHISYFDSFDDELMYVRK